MYFDYENVKTQFSKQKNIYLGGGQILQFFGSDGGFAFFL